ncbi:Si-specific NAD(P)(+) transhydrogenase [Tundrisphaera lichenicola]|uniref:Si-specific NAD(P)(+) transhydrogenase n=1 Tax=Tundrisphaera lichenicola TaxID=2029860 RepID=UPI003EBF1B1F
MEQKTYDLVVIGSGPAGEKGASQAAYFGKSVALIEKEPCLGGASANTGTLPSKTLRETALFLSGFRNRSLYGIQFSLKQKVSVRDFMARERYICDTERARIQANLKRHQVRVYSGAASFVDPHIIAIKPNGSPEIRIRGEKFLIATGSSPHRPPIFPFHDPRILDSDTILNLRDMPETLLVCGGGVIGCEYACMFAALGVKVTLIEQRERIVGFLDHEISSALRDGMESLGVRMMLNDTVVAIRNEMDLELHLKSGAVLTSDYVLVSSGRSSNTSGLGLEEIGITLGKRGLLPVNENYRTVIDHIYGAGDVIGAPALASTSMEQARVAMVDAFDLKYKKSVSHFLPYGIYTIPECSMAGATEEELTAKQVPYIVGRATYQANARGQIIGDNDGFLKLLFDAGTMKLLGVHVIGEQATELVHIGLTALLMGADADLFINTCYNYPTLSEIYKYATYDALGRRALLGAAVSPTA